MVGPAPPVKIPGKVAPQGITLAGYDDDNASQKWIKLEEMLVTEAQGSLPFVFKPLITLFTMKHKSNANPVAVIGEPIQVSVKMFNPLQIPLTFKDIYLLWQYTDKKNRFAANELMGNNLEHMKTQVIKSIVLYPTTTQEVVLSVTPLYVGEVTLKGICYMLHCTSSDQGTTYVAKGKQTFIEEKYEKLDKQFQITIVPQAPCLQVNHVKIVLF